WRLDRRTTETLVDLAETINPIVRGWMNYWGHFYRSEMFTLLQRINTYLMRWARLKYKRLRGFKRLKAWWDRVVKRAPNLFAHWQGTTRVLPTAWYEPCESRGSRTEPWEPAGETPAGPLAERGPGGW